MLKAISAEGMTDKVPRWDGGSSVRGAKVVDAQAMERRALRLGKYGKQRDTCMDDVLNTNNLFCSFLFF